MKAKRYKLTVYEGVLAWTHGWGQRIEELFFPKARVAVNLLGGAFTTPPDRYSKKEVEYLGGVDIPDEDAKVFIQAAKLKDEVAKLAKKYIKERP